MKKIIAMSGGVDSSVSLMLSSRKYGAENLLGVTLATGGDNPELREADENNSADAKAVCDLFGVEHTTLDVSEKFARCVKDVFADEYLRGRTPNPCVVCNREIKFGILADYARETGADGVITGHYARLERRDGHIFVRRAADEKKDQSYMLALLTEEQLSLAEFPLGEMTKSEVRELAEKNSLISAKRRDSQDVCFIPDGDYVRFISEYRNVSPVPGNYTDIGGKVLGKHCGHWCYTIGQRKGLGISMGHHVFVLDKNAETNTVILGDEDGLMKTTVSLSSLHFPYGIPERTECTAKLRYAHRAAEAVFESADGLRGTLTFAEPQRAPSPGQFAVIYVGELVAGCGIISEL